MTPELFNNAIVYLLSKQISTCFSSLFDFVTFQYLPAQRVRYLIKKYIYCLQKLRMLSWNIQYLLKIDKNLTEINLTHCNFEINKETIDK